MTEKVSFLRPDQPATIQATRADPEVMAAALERFAQAIRSGEETALFGSIVWYDHQRCPCAAGFGPQTLHDNLLLMTLAQHMAAQAALPGG